MIVCIIEICLNTMLVQNKSLFLVDRYTLTRDMHHSSNIFLHIWDFKTYFSATITQSFTYRIAYDMDARNYKSKSNLYYCVLHLNRVLWNMSNIWYFWRWLSGLVLKSEQDKIEFLRKISDVFKVVLSYKKNSSY